MSAFTELPVRVRWLFGMSLCGVACIVSEPWTGAVFAQVGLALMAIPAVLVGVVCLFAPRRWVELLFLGSCTKRKGEDT